MSAIDMADIRLSMPSSSTSSIEGERSTAPSSAGSSSISSGLRAAASAGVAGVRGGVAASMSGTGNDSAPFFFSSPMTSLQALRSCVCFLGASR